MGTLLAIGAGGCHDENPTPLPDPPDGMDLVLVLGELEVYGDPEICEGTFRRLERHVDGLSDLLEIEPPPARIFVHADPNAARAACGWDRPGCATSSHAHALPDNLRHEVAHVMLYATGRSRTRAFVEEGLAERLEGGAVESSIDDLENFEALIAVRRSSDFSPADYYASAGFFAWAIETFGVERTLRARAEVARAETDEAFATALAESFGFASLAELYAEYAQGHADRYPPLPDTVTAYTAAELASGIAFDSSCAGPYAEGPMADPAVAPAGDAWTVTRFEIAVPGEHVLTPSDLHLLGLEQEPSLTTTETTWDPLPPPTDRHPRSCNADEPFHFWYELAGHYEFSVRHDPSESIQTTLQLQRVERDLCSP